MSRSRQFQSIAYADACDEVRAVYDDFMRVTGMPFVIDYLRCQGNYPAVLQGNWSKIKNTLYSGQLPLLLKELVVYSISRQRGCKYCTFLHGMAADRMGAGSDGARLTESLTTSELPSSYKTAIELATRWAINPMSREDEDTVRLRDDGFADAEIVELMAVVDLTNMLNTFVELSGIEIDPDLLHLKG